MEKLFVQEPNSGGILLSYKCTGECKHCMYNCSPNWKADWISEKGVERILTQLSSKIKGTPYEPNGIGINYGLHFTGGEPFLNFDLLLKVTRIAFRLGIPSTFVETNCFWCADDETTRKKLTALKDAGLNGILISVNPFILEQVPFKRTERAVKISAEIFSGNVIIYQRFFYQQFKELNIQDTLPFEEYLQLAGYRSLSYIELLPMGRAAYKLAYLHRKHSAERFFGENCIEELTRPWHIHIDNYRNYMSGYCGGISLGDADDISSICQGVDLHNHPILDALATDIEKLHILAVRDFGYKDREEGYISKCHLCVDIRKHISQQTDKFMELNPREFYDHLT